MNRQPSSLYRASPVDGERRIAAAIDRGCARATGLPRLFFRADDIGVPSAGFSRMVDSFRHHRLPLCLATVPGWLTAARWQALREITGHDSSQWYWHQHGRSHRNYQPEGKKQEFGPARSAKAVRQSLAEGCSRLRLLQGDVFQPVFTPPWNRCSAETLTALMELDFQAISRSRGSQPPAPPGLAEYVVNVDLHTRRESDPEASFAALLGELEEALAGGRAGIMLHHQRMNQAAFALLDRLLGLLRPARLRAVHFGDLLAEERGRMAY